MESSGDDAVGVAVGGGPVEAVGGGEVVLCV